MKKLTDLIKRLIDCLLAAICLIIFSPLFLYCFIAIKREDGGPAIYKQVRIGLHGKPFYIYKFRSMHTGAEEDGYHLFTGDEDERLTRIGRKLRDHHLDELPSCGMCLSATWPSSDHAPSVPTISGRFWK